ncbi:MAG: zf-HC2 domain-containing protein, partial [Gaiellaceae bacterium]
MMHLSPQQLSAHLDSALHGASLQLVEGHLESCERCRDELAALTLQDHMLGEALRGDTDRELFDLIGLRVQSVVHPQRARALEKSIAELERTREERRRHAEEVARRVTELRQHGPGDDERPMDQSTRPSHEFPPVPESTVPNADDFSPQFTPLDPPAPAFHPEPEAPMSAAAGLRRRALDEARTRAEAEARAFALESERAQEAAERHALEQAASRARLEAVARRKAEEDGRARAAASARIEAEHLARAAEAAMVEAENSARDATAAKARAEARAAAAEEAHRQAQRKAEEARRLEARLAEPPESETHAAEVFLLADSEPSMLTPEAVAAYRVQPLDEDDEVPPARVRARRQPPPAREPKRSPALALTASFLILAVAFWFAVGRQLWPGPGTNAPTTAAIEPHASGDAG